MEYFKKLGKGHSGKAFLLFHYKYRQVYKAEFQDPETGEKRQVALKKLNLINEKDGVRYFQVLVILLVSNYCAERNPVSKVVRP